ncbi:hypothetical protein ACFFF7_10020 [Novosphingobium aquiterrae]|uniref:Uncharacterized protein n=1 Tax=Novosphingobium aquiterrae TaxID=624388 RepID=A0ABV6PL17_9SPHN
MEIAFNPFNGLSLASQFAGEGPITGALDWFSLQTRFAAAHAARRELNRFDSGQALPRGDFSHWAHGPTFAERAKPDVNPIDLAVRKGAVGMVAAVADTAPRSGRGLK